MTSLTPTLQNSINLALAERERRRRQASNISAWPTIYVNRDTGRTYTPHHEAERRFVAEDGPWRYGLAKGGEGGGKSTCGVIKTLERLRRGMSGIMVGTDLEHFKKSLWPEFRRWCPWDQVVPAQRRRQHIAWEPQHAFSLAFINGAVLLCGGIDDPASWEGPNANFFHFDEARRKKDPQALKVLDGRIRIPGPNGEPPQGWITTTPRKHWLYDYFGPAITSAPDPFADFKHRSYVIDLLTKDNATNLAPGFVEDRARTLTEAEQRVLLEAAWEDIDDVDRFLPSMTWWDACRDDIPPLDDRTPVVAAMDGAVSGDNFALVLVSRHPARPRDIMVRGLLMWEPRGTPLDFIAIQNEIVQFLSNWYTLQLAYDPTQLHQMAQQIQATANIWCEPFNQGPPRLIADKQLLDLILRRGISHDGDTRLRQAIDNADRKIGSEDRQTLRIVKRTSSLKNDLAVALSMAAARCLDLNL